MLVFFLGQPQYPNNFSNLSFMFTHNVLKITRIFDRENSEKAIQWCSLEYNRMLKSHITDCFLLGQWVFLLLDLALLC